MNVIIHANLLLKKGTQADLVRSKEC